MDLFTLTAKLGMDSSEFVAGIKKADQEMEQSKKTYSQYLSDRAKLAAKYQKEGLDKSSAWKKANADIDRSMYDFTKKSAKAADTSKRHWWNWGKSVGQAGNSAFSKLGTGIQSVSAKTIAIGNLMARGIEKAVDTIGRLGSSAIQASADIAAENAQFTAAFGELEAAASGTFAGISKDTGILSTRLKNVGTKAFSQFKGAGLDAVSALSSMDTYTRLAADAAAYYDISLEDADERLRSFLRGNTEAGDSIGLFTSETQRNNKALEIYGQKWLDLTEAQKQMLMLDVANDIYEQSGAIGQAQREADGWANVVGNLKEAWRQTLGVIGTPFTEGLTPVVQKLTEFLSDDTVVMRIGMLAASLGDMAGKSFEGAINLLDELLKWSNGEEANAIFGGLGDIGDALGKIAGLVFDGVTGFLNILIGGPDGMEDTVDNIGLFLSDIGGFIDDYAEGITVLIGAITGFMLISNPFALLIAALASIIANWEDIKKWTDSAWQALMGFIETHIPEGFLDAVVTVLETISGIIHGIKSTWDAFVNSLSSANVSKGVANIEKGFEQGGLIGGVSSAIGEAWWNPFKGSKTSATVGNRGATGSFATGLDYVPYDDFRARLHAGEAVLNRAEATSWRRGDAAGTIDASAIASAVASAVREALDGVGVYMGAERVGDLVTDRVSRNIAKSAWNRRYQPV